jgi:hypothetical protein
MDPKESRRFKHLLLNNSSKAEKFRLQGYGDFPLKPRQRDAHGSHLKKQLEDIKADIEKNDAMRNERAVAPGSFVQFESDFGFELKVESLSSRKQGIEVVAFKTETVNDEEKQFATVFVPEGKMEVFLKKVEDYLTKETTPKDTKEGEKKEPKPRNKDLIESIANVRLAALKSLWTETEKAKFPDDPKQPIWWEAWLRTGKDEEERNRIVDAFRVESERAELKVKKETLKFPDATVALVYGTAEQMTQSVFSLNVLAEVRRAKETAEFFTALSNVEQNEWVQDLLSRVDPPGDNAPAICLLDSGVNNGHPLLKLGLLDGDMDAYDRSWGTSDDNPKRTQGRGHGTEMAGLALYGDLVEPLVSAQRISLTHRLESVKILPNTGCNEPEHYGAITSESIARPEVFAPNRNRVFSLTVTTKDGRDQGAPSAWSAAIDQQCADALAEDSEKKRRLVLISAGNVEPCDPNYLYPESCETEEVHDPGQAWNAITVGAYTEKDTFVPTKDISPLWRPLAPKGGLCPVSSTSLTWKDHWPLKPDIVCEGGNYAKHPEFTSPDKIDPLRLLTTNADFRQTLLTTTGDTSGAAALAARMCAQIYAEYPNFWPETVRGLLIHSAEWTSQMLDGRNPSKIGKAEYKQILRKFGFGVPNLERARFSASNSLTLIAQDEIQPFAKEEGKSNITLNKMNLHTLPWPVDVLQNALANETVEMRVTLSYFIEPRPGRKLPSRPANYASHGLRFEVKDAGETDEAFQKRINRAAREEDEKVSGASADGDSWRVGTKLRHRGSLHSDVWNGSGADLAEKNQIAVFPVGGWWKNIPNAEKWGSRARYSLIVTITTPQTNIDIYTPVANIVKTSISVSIE